MIKVGLTGGIGSGKSIVSQMFKILNIPVYNSDIRAKALYTESEDVRQAVIELFGEEAYQTDGKLNRNFIGQRVFSNSEILQKLNSIIHPAVAEDFERWISNQKSPYIIKEAAILFESGANRSMDKIIGVSAPLELRISRVISRDGSTRDQVLARIQKQMAQDELIERCDYHITNDGQKLLIPQILQIHAHLINQ